MTTPFPFVAGQVLTAAQLNDIQNLPISDKTASYTLVATDVFKRTIMNNAGATTITVDDAIFTEGDVIQIANKGAGVCTITASVGVTINTSGSLALAQYGGGYLLCLSASTFTFFNLGGGNAYGTATGGIGAPTAVTISGVNYEYLTFNSTGTLTVTKAGFFDYLAIGGGTGCLNYTTGASVANSGGGAGQVVFGSVYLSANQTITIGAGSSPTVYGGGNIFNEASPTTIAATSPFTQTALNGFWSMNIGGGSDAYVGGGCGSFSTGSSFAFTESLAQGYRGGNSVNTTSAAGGGGQSGRGGNGSGTTGGVGGTGVDISTFIGGSASYRATGGGGGGSVTGGAGGNSSASSNAGVTGTAFNSASANSGSGGGGGISVLVSGGNGGSGVAFIRWRV